MIPRVEQLVSTAERSAAERTAPWIRRALAAAASALIFVVGAEIGYQDGLEPAVPGRQETATIVVTSSPNVLSEDDLSFVMGIAEGLLSVIRRTDFVARLGRAHAGDAMPVERRDSLTLMARATNDDVEVIYVTLAWARDARPDSRQTRDGELASWSRELVDVRPDSETIGLEASFGYASAPPRSAFYQTQVLPPSSTTGGSFVLIANFRFDRTEIEVYPGWIQADATRHVALAINEQMARLENVGML